MGISLWGTSIRKRTSSYFSQPVPCSVFSSLEIPRLLTCVSLFLELRNLVKEDSLICSLGGSEGLREWEALLLGSPEPPEELSGFLLGFICMSKWINAWSEFFHLFQELIHKVLLTSSFPHPELVCLESTDLNLLFLFSLTHKKISNKMDK